MSEIELDRLYNDLEHQNMSQRLLLFRLVFLCKIGNFQIIVSSQIIAVVLKGTYDWSHCNSD
jgi:hypothetical protein